MATQDDEAAAALTKIRGRWGPERISRKKERTVKPSTTHKQEFLYHGAPGDAVPTPAQANQLTEFELQEFKDAFEDFDPHARGVLCTADMVRLVTMLGYDAEDTEVQDLVLEKNGENDLVRVVTMLGYDAEDTEVQYLVLEKKGENGSDEVTFAEYMTLMARIRKDEGDEDLREAFLILDPNYTGSIGATELAKVMKDLGHDLSHADLKGMVQEADKTGDGRITFEEFCQIMKGAS